MKLRVLYWLIGLILIGTASFVYWQYRQEQWQAQLKLQLLDATLQLANERAEKAAENIVKAIAHEVAENANQAHDREVLRLSREIHLKTNHIAKQIDAERIALLKASEKTQISKELSQEIDGYTNYITHFAGNVWPELEQKLTIVPDLLFISQAKRYTQLYREQGKAVEVMAMLTQQEAVLRAYESTALSTLAQKVGRSWDGFFRIEPFATAESNAVAIGDIYKAKLFLTSSGGGRIVRMTANGSQIPVAPDGRGSVRFRVPVNAAKGRAYWKATIRAYVQGRDSTFTLTVPYTVRAD